MTETTSTLERLVPLICEVMNVTPERVTAEADIYDDLGGDDLDRLEITMAVEEEFGIELSDDDLGFMTIGSLVENIDNKLKERK